MTPWLDCAPCRFPPDPGAHDRSAGDRPAILALIHQSVRGLSNSRRTNRPARVPAAFGHLMSGSPHRQQACCWPIPPEIRRDSPISIPVMSLSSAPTTRFGGFGLRLVRRMGEAESLHGLSLQMACKRLTTWFRGGTNGPVSYRSLLVASR